MKKSFKILFLSLALLAAGHTNAQMLSHAKKEVKNKIEHKSEKSEEAEGYIPAIRMINNPDGTCTFENGKLPILKHMNTTTFWLSNKTEDWEKNAHPAPRRQYVITLKGQIEFKVSDGSKFIIKPGVILLAEDLKGTGHSWEMINSNTWERLYVPITEGADDLFIKDAI